MLAGDPATALASPNTAVLTENAARRYFGDADPLGQVLRLDSGFSEADYLVTGVLADVPHNSHLHFDLLLSFSSLETVQEERVVLDSWWLLDCYTYLLLPEGYRPEELDEKLQGFIDRHLTASWVRRVDLHLQPITDIHLRSQLSNEIEPNSDDLYIYLFAAVALFTLVIACINFMNLATARSAHRAKEVGVRKVVGAHRSQLIDQFLGESFLLTLLALALALILVGLSLPAFNAFTGKEMTFAFDLFFSLALVGTALFVALVAGSYPALFLSSFKPVQVLKGSLSAGVKSASFRRLLVVFQFATSLVLLVSTAIVYAQVRYLREHRLGFDQERTVVIPIRDVSLRERYLAAKDELEKNAGVVGTTLSSLLMGRGEAPNLAVFPEGKTSVLIDTLIVDQDFLDVFGVELVAGRNFSRDNESDVTHAFLINESAVPHLGWESPEDAIDRRLEWAGWKRGRVIGVVRDFHYQALTSKIEPLVMHIRPIVFHYLYAKIAADDPAPVLAHLEDSWRRVFPGRPFEYLFLDDEFDRAYRAEERLGKVFGLFAAGAIFVACLGLLGLASFTAEQRTREIGIRKVVGASTSGVVLLLSKEFTKLVLVAVVIGWGVTYLAMSRWLTRFAYRMDLSPGSFLLGGLVVVTIAWLTVGYQALRAARIRPVEALKYE